jgi:signal transduction histidine kinase
MNETARPPAEIESTILVIDDEPANLLLIKMAVARERFRCNLVLLDSARKGLEYLEAHDADLLLLDVVMPVMNGFEMFTRLKSDSRWSEIPVIFLSAVNEPRYIIQGLEMGAVDYIGKPLISQVLTARFRSVLRTRFLQRELRKRNAEMENANRLKDELLSFCSHDLRAPIAAIELTCQFLRDVLSDEGRTAPESLIERILNQTRLARRLVENLLDMHKIEEGKLITQPAFFSPHELLRGCTEDHQPLLLARNLKFELHQENADTICFGDRELIAQMVRNLLGNAIKFARARVTIRSRLEPGEGGAGGWWLLDVSDDGPGFTPGTEHELFSKYARGEPRQGGYGLGLYIAQQTVRLHNGFIAARSTPQEQTVISARLPLAFHLDAIPDLSPVSHARVRVLATAKPMSELLESILLEGGLVHVQNGASGETILDELAATPPDLAVVDLASSPVDAPRLLKLIQQAQPATRWLLVGSTQELDEFQRQSPTPVPAVALPVDPVVYLRRVLSLLNDRAGCLLPKRD